VASNNEKPGNAGSAFILWHVHTIDGEDDAKLIGVYRSREDAEAATSRLVGRSGFSTAPDGFHIDEYEIGIDHWTEGYVTT
jgi:hypothetical protein